MDRPATDTGQDFEKVIGQAVDRLKDAVEDTADNAQQQAIEAAAALADAAKALAEQAQAQSRALAEDAIDTVKAHPLVTAGVTAAILAGLASLALIATRRNNGGGIKTHS